MTQVAEERPAVAPLTNPVPGAWLQSSDNSMPPVYVPFEPQYRKSERTNKDELTGHTPGAHIVRLLGEGWMYTNGPTGAAQAPAQELASTEAALRAELEQAKADRERLFEELKELREKIAADPHVPGASKRR